MDYSGFSTALLKEIMDTAIRDANSAMKRANPAARKVLYDIASKTFIEAQAEYMRREG